MPPGSKKRRAARRKKHHDRNRNPHRAEEVEEVFETPRSQLDPIDYMPVPISGTEPAAAIVVESSQVLADGKEEVEEGTPSSSSNEKEGKVVPWPDEEAVGNGGSAEDSVVVDGELIDSLSIEKGAKVVPWPDEEETVKLGDSAEDSVVVDADELIDTLSLEKEGKELPKVKVTRECYLAAAQTEDEPKLEVARGPVVVRRASLWNCCGLLELIYGVDS